MIQGLDQNPGAIRITEDSDQIGAKMADAKDKIAPLQATSNAVGSSGRLSGSYANTSNVRQIKKYTSDQPGGATTLGRVGIITNGFESTYYGQMVESASNYLMARGFQALVQSNLHSRLGELDAWSSLTEIQCDGLIIHADSLSDDELNSLMEQYPKAVMLNRFLKAFPSRCVYVDNVEGGRIAARCLLDHGHEKIAMVQGPAKFFEARERALGFTRELEKNNQSTVMILEGNFLENSGEIAMEKIMNSREKITAVFFQNDEMAFGALNTCRRQNIRVPEDISIIGYDGLPVCEYVSPRLTSVQQPLHQIGDHAAAMVCDLLLDTPDASSSSDTGYSPVLAERESVAPPSGHNDEKVKLTRREQECLSWTAGGKTSWEISVILGISESTATFHLRNAGVKLKASNRTHAVAKALSNGLIELLR